MKKSVLRLLALFVLMFGFVMESELAQWRSQPRTQMSPSRFADWKEVCSGIGYFSIQFPSQPAYESPRYISSGSYSVFNPIHSLTYSNQAGTTYAVYTVTYRNLKDSLYQTPEKAFESLVKEIKSGASDEDTKVNYENSTKRAGFYKFEISETISMHILGVLQSTYKQIIVTNAHIYILTVELRGDSKTTHSEADHFFNSFNLRDSPCVLNDRRFIQPCVKPIPVGPVGTASSSSPAIILDFKGPKCPYSDDEPPPPPRHP